MVLAQYNTIGDQVRHLNQDLVLALSLIEESHPLIRPDENYAVVAKRSFQPDASIVGIHIRTDVLRDYLCARGTALRLLTYRKRTTYEATADRDGPFNPINPASSAAIEHLRWHTDGRGASGNSRKLLLRYVSKERGREEPLALPTPKFSQPM